MGVNRAPGYYNPDNPNDTGRARERNYPGGRRNATNWDYERGVPLDPNTPRDAEGNYILSWEGGGSGGSGAYAIPGSAFWKEEEAAALRDWTTMQNALRKQQRNLNTLFGMSIEDTDEGTGLGTKFGIDPRSTMGLFQQMFQSQAGGQYALEDDIIGRGLAGSGIGGADWRDYKYQTDVERATAASDFTSQMDEVASQYAAGQADYNDLIRRIRAQAAMDAYNSNDYIPQTGVDPSKPSGDNYDWTQTGGVPPYPANLSPMDLAAWNQYSWRYDPRWGKRTSQTYRPKRPTTNVAPGQPGFRPF